MPRSFSLLAASLLVVAACGDTSGVDPTDAPAAAPTTTVAAAAPTTTTTATPTPTTTTTSTAPTTTLPPAAATTTTAPAAAPEPGWSQLATTNDPPARTNPVLVVDADSRAAYLHGGRVGGDSLDDLWRLDLTSGAWEQLQPAGPAPAPRFTHTGVWDSRRNRLVVFSGQGTGFGDFFSDVWAYDAAANAWEELAPDGAGPANRYGTCAGYDSVGDRFLITHGFTDDGRFDDTWAFDLATATWTDVTPTGARPGERCLHACAYDSGAGSLVLFGGQDNDAPFLGDTWSLGTDGWTEVGGDGPTPRKFPAIAANETGVILFGGTGADGRTADTWRIGGAGAWQAVATPAAPPARESHAAAYDSGTATVIIFGGTGADGLLADTWLLSGME